MSARRRSCARAALWGVLCVTGAWLAGSPAVARADDDAERVAFGASMGAGVGSLAIVRPTADGAQRLPNSAFPALDLAVGLHAERAQPVSYEIAVAYRSSLGLALELQPLFGLSQRVPVRAQRAELAFAPRIRLGATKQSAELAFPIGAVLRTFVPELHQFGLPNYMLAGPLLRVELLASLGEGVHLRIGPELQWLALVDSSLRDQGACCQGVALGGQGSLEANLGDTLSVALKLRESHAFVGQGGRGFTEVERFATAVLAGRL